MIITKPSLLTIIAAITLISGGTGVYLLSQDKTIEHKLIRQGEKLIETDNEYLVAFKEHRSNNKFINLIKGNDDTISLNVDLNKGKVALKRWCTINLQLSLNERNIKNSFQNSKNYCIKPPMTIDEKIQKSGKKLLDNWENKLDELKKPTMDEELITDLKAINIEVIDLEKPEKSIISIALRDWCKGQGGKNLVDSSTDNIWTKVEKRCIRS